MNKFIWAALLTVAVTPGYALHPLITDDTGTQGARKVQMEMNSEYARDKAEGVREKTLEAASIVSYGVRKNVDLVLGLPVSRLVVMEAGDKTVSTGLSDAPVEVKWRCWERGGFSLALKPGVTFPTGKSEEGLGAGKAAVQSTLIATRSGRRGALHLNLAYNRNENRLEERRDLWHASLASESAVRDNLRLVVNAGVERSPAAGGPDPAFALGGLVYSPWPNVDLDLGAKVGLNRTETHRAILAGVSTRF